RHDAGRETSLFADSLDRRGVHALPHFRVTVQNLDPSLPRRSRRRVQNDADPDVAALDGAIAEAGALDAAADAFVLRALVHIFDRIECLADASNALAHDLA